jgi:CelD/BcsL family acetyltransferase involved in cellulose biosynthesis
MLAAVSSATVTRAVTLDVISDTSAFAELRPEWSSLLDSNKSNCFFLTWEWLYTWWRHLAGDRRLYLLAVRTDDELVALAPFCVTPRFRFGHLLETVEFLGSGFAGSDYLDIIAKEGYEQIAVTALSTHLARQPYALRLTNVKSDSLAADLSQKLHQSQWTLTDLQINICPYVPLSGMTWESYLGTLGSEHRYNFRRKLQRINKEFTVERDTPRSFHQCHRDLDATVALHNLRWDGRGRSDAFHTPELIAFHRDIAPLAFARRWLRLYVLRLNGRPAASLYGFLYGGKFYFYQSGFDPAFAKCSVGLLTMGLAIQDALKEHAVEFDLLHGDESYKSHWAPLQRGIRRFELFPANTLGRFSNISVDMIRNARRMALGVLKSGR